MIHLHLKSSGEDFYYGNLKSLFDCQEQEMNDGSLGVRYKYLVNFKFDVPYENEFVVIKKAELITDKKQSGTEIIRKIKNNTYRIYGRTNF